MKKWNATLILLVIVVVIIGAFGVLFLTPGIMPGVGSYGAAGGMQQQAFFGLFFCDVLVNLG